MAQQLEDEYCTVAEAARLLKVSHSTVWRWIDAKRLPAYRVGPKNIRIKRSDLAEVIAPVKPDPGEVPSMREAQPADSGFVPRPLNGDEQAQVFEFLAEARKLREAILARRNGVPFDDSTEIIRQAREERSRHLLGL